MRPRAKPFRTVPGVGERERRLAENENLFRRINEQVEELAAGGAAEFLCECADAECTDRVELTIAEYEDVRAAPARFVLRAGHERPAVETVLDQGNGYVIVEKRGEAGDVAADDDPRDG